MVQFNIPGMTAKQFDRAWDELRKAGQEDPLGLSIMEPLNKVIIGFWLMFGNLQNISTNLVKP